MRFLNLKYATIGLLATVCPIVSFAAALPATLTYSIESEELTVFKTTTPPDQACVQTSAGNQFPTACSNDSANGHIKASVGGNFIGPGGTFNQTIELTGSATASIFKGPNPNTIAANAGYTIQIVVGPQVAGDTFSFTLQQTNTCSDSLGDCVADDAVVLGATSVKGKLDKGQKITASGPVTIYLTHMLVVTNVAPVWSQTVGATLDITPRKEARTPALLNDDN